jgi:hypothetical protein
MSSKKGRITEAKVGIAVLKILAAKPNGAALIRDLKKELPDYLNLSDEDRAPTDLGTTGPQSHFSSCG